MSKSLVQCAATLAIIGMLVGTAGAWGSLGHQMIGEGAVLHLPPQMQPFFSDNLNLVASAVAFEPQRPPEHVFKIERFTNWPNTPVPRDKAMAIATYGEQWLIETGETPWAAAEWTQQLTTEMSNAVTYSDWQSLIYTAGVAGHYITDLHQPLHVTDNTNGSSTGNNGIHARYEVTMIEAYADQLTFTPSTAQYVPSVIDRLFDDIEGTTGLDTGNHQYVDDIIAADNVARAIDPGYGTAYTDSLWNGTSGFTQTVFQDASQQLADIWYTAWVDAGSPIIPAPPGPVPFNTVGYWRLEEGPLGGTASTVVSEFNSPALNGLDSGFPNQTYSNDVPSPTIYNPDTGTAAPNNFSLFSGTNSSSARFDVNGSEVELDDFTFEMFVKDDVPTDFFHAVASKARDDGKYTWALFIDTAGNLRLRVDSEDGSVGAFNEVIRTDSPMQDGEWHHIAVTYQGDITTYELFYDYELVGRLTPSNNGSIVYDGGALTVGGRIGNSWKGLIDEVRLTDAAITPQQFLTTTLPTADGDFDGDGDVDGADFLTWQRDPGIGDLAEWQANYGASLAPATSEVPEPSCLLLMFATAIVLRSKRPS